MTESEFITESNEFIAKCYGHLGEVLEKLGRCEDAEQAVSKAVMLKRKVMPTSTQLIVDLKNLVAMKQRKGLKSDAADLCREILQITIKLFGDSHLQTANARALLANAFVGSVPFAMQPSYNMTLT